MRAKFKFDYKTDNFTIFTYYDYDKNVGHKVYIPQNALIPSANQPGVELDLIYCEHTGRV